MCPASPIPTFFIRCHVIVMAFGSICQAPKNRRLPHAQADSVGAGLRPALTPLQAAFSLEAIFSFCYNNSVQVDRVIAGDVYIA